MSPRPRPAQKKFLTEEDLRAAGVDNRQDADDAELIAEGIERLGQALYYTFAAALELAGGFTQPTSRKPGELHETAMMQWRKFALFMIKVSQ